MEANHPNLEVGNHQPPRETTNQRAALLVASLHPEVTRLVWIADVLALLAAADDQVPLDAVELLARFAPQQVPDPVTAWLCHRWLG